MPPTTMMNSNDETYMRRALQLAALGRGHTFSNPMVGAVIVDADGTIIGEGYHQTYGEGHAEVNACRAAKEAGHTLRGATIYVTLEPCSHYGKTPPCAQLLIDEGFKRVVVGVKDPFAKVSGRGIEMLRQAGIDVEVGVLEAECEALNQRFITAHRRRRPWVTLKWAQSRDGFIDRVRGLDEAPTRFSTPESSIKVHRLRAEHTAIVVGAGTVIADNPTLTARGVGPVSQPVPVILDAKGRVPIDSRVLNRTDVTPIYLTASPRDDMPRGVMQLPAMPVKDLLAELYGRGLTSVLVEGGAQVAQQFIDAGLYDELHIETAPIFLGDGVRAPMIYPQ